MWKQTEDKQNTTLKLRFRSVKRAKTQTHKHIQTHKFYRVRSLQENVNNKNKPVYRYRANQQNSV